MKRNTLLKNIILVENVVVLMKKTFDKYWHYRHSVQSPDLEVRFIQKCYQELKKKTARVFREDFCFTFALGCEWVKLNRLYKSVAVDLDPKPLRYGKAHNLARLSLNQQKRMNIIHSNVLNHQIPSADIISALNFSYFVFKEREEMKRYFSNCLKSLRTKGLLVLDCFGGSQCFEANEEQIDYGDFIYCWDQKGFDPISHHALFHIHYKRKREKKRERVFTYDWRIWTIPELKDLLREVGFRKIHIYWEGTDKNGEGSGRFTRREKGEECGSWVAYIISEK